MSNEAQKVEVIVRKEAQNMAENDDVEQLKSELEEERSMREDYENKLKLIGEQKLADKIAELNIPEDQQQFFRDHPEALKGYELAKNRKEQTFDKKSGKGTVAMSKEMIAKESGSDNSKREFDSVEEMIDWARKNDPEAYQQIKEKAYRGLSENRQYFEWQDEFDENGRSIIGRTIQKMNAQARAKAKGE